MILLIHSILLRFYNQKTTCWSILKSIIKNIGNGAIADVDIAEFIAKWLILCWCQHRNKDDSLLLFCRLYEGHEGTEFGQHVWGMGVLQVGSRKGARNSMLLSTQNHTSLRLQPMEFFAQDQQLAHGFVEWIPDWESWTLPRHHQQFIPVQLARLRDIEIFLSLEVNMRDRTRVPNKRKATNQLFPDFYEGSNWCGPSLPRIVSSIDLINFGPTTLGISSISVGSTSLQP